MSVNEKTILHSESRPARRTADTQPSPSSTIVLSPSAIAARDRDVAAEKVRANAKDARPFALRELSTETISSLARAVVSLSLTADLVSKNQDLIPINVLDGLYMVVQSSEKTSFAVHHNAFAFRMYYAPGDDSFAFINLSDNNMTLVPLEPRGDRRNSEVPPHNTNFPAKVAPGSWAIRAPSARGPMELVGQFVLLRRRYELTMTKSETSGQAGTKRGRDAGPSTQPAKAIKISDDQSVVVIHAFPPNSGGSSELTMTEEKYPLDQLQTEHVLRIGPPSAVRDSSPCETYTLAKLRDIIKTRSNAGVFLGDHSSLGLVAVKNLRNPKYLSHIIPRIARSFEHELNMLKKIDHPSIIKFKGSDARLFSIYMEYLPYQDLNGWMSDIRGAPDRFFFTGNNEDALEILRGTASALQYLSDQSVYHNDIKPGNILFARERGPVLIDFGLATDDDSKPTGGTPWYLPSQFIGGETRGSKGDVFALGVTMLYLLRKTGLPEKKERWDIFEARAEAGYDRSHMLMWLYKVEEMRQSLLEASEPSHIENIVGSMLHDSLEERISAHDLTRRLKHVDVS